MLAVKFQGRAVKFQGCNMLAVKFQGRAVKFQGCNMFFLVKYLTLRLLGMSWGVKTTCLEAPGVSLGGSGVSIGGVGSLRV